jgi:DNA-binding response OmpR family regulator
VHSALQGRRVLIVEDEMLVALEIEDLLQQQGCVVLGPAPRVNRALTLLDRERPDAALLDLNLRGELATPVAAELSAQGVPFVLVTGYGKMQSREPELRDAPRVDKPVHHRELLRVLAQVLESDQSGACERSAVAGTKAASRR